MEQEVIENLIGQYGWMAAIAFIFILGRNTIETAIEAIKVFAGDDLNTDEMRELVNRLFGTIHPYFCPHGRPIIVQLSMDELDRRFERI